jgi:hypothetical protein
MMVRPLRDYGRCGPCYPLDVSTIRNNIVIAAIGVIPIPQGVDMRSDLAGQKGAYTTKINNWWKKSW